jgi:hypothetical protein
MMKKNIKENGHVVNLIDIIRILGYEIFKHLMMRDVLVMRETCVGLCNAIVSKDIHHPTRTKWRPFFLIPPSPFAKMLLDDNKLSFTNDYYPGNTMEMESMRYVTRLKCRTSEHFNKCIGLCFGIKVLRIEDFCVREGCTINLMSLKSLQFLMMTPNEKVICNVLIPSNVIELHATSFSAVLIFPQNEQCKLKVFRYSAERRQPHKRNHQLPTNLHLDFVGLKHCDLPNNLNWHIRILDIYGPTNSVTLEQLQLMSKNSKIQSDIILSRSMAAFRFMDFVPGEFMTKLRMVAFEIYPSVMSHLIGSKSFAEMLKLPNLECVVLFFCAINSFEQGILTDHDLITNVILSKFEVYDPPNLNIHNLTSNGGRCYVRKNSTTKIIDIDSMLRLLNKHRHEMYDFLRWDLTINQFM